MCFSKLDFSDKNTGAVERIWSSNPPFYHSATYVIERMLNWH